MMIAVFVGRKKAAATPQELVAKFVVEADDR
jgi:hypothetical protein